MTDRSEVYKAIDSERDYQEVRWGPDKTDTGHKHSILEWLVYMQDYIAEALHIESRMATRDADKLALENIRKVVALGVVAMEQHGAPLRKMK